MAVNNMPFPAFAKIFYHSPFAPHTMIVPTRIYNVPNTSFPDGFYTAWDASTVDASTMFTTHITNMATQMPSNVNFDAVEFWTKSAPAVPPILRHRKAISIPGTSTLTGWQEATQRTYFLRGIDNGAVKIVLLDTITDNQFSKDYVVTTPETTMLNWFTNSSNAFQTKSGSQPFFFRSLVITLNERLRRSYHLR